MFADRERAGERLADALAPRLAHERCRVYGLARGGVVVARPVAERLGVPLELLIVCKIGAPGQPELALGALAEGGGAYWDQVLLAMFRVGPEWLADAIDRARREVERRVEEYRGRPLSVPADELALVVDDGIATGSTVIAALRSLRALGAERLGVAVPVGAAESIRLLEREADWVHALRVPQPFLAVGQYYERFDPVTDGELRSALAGR